MSRAVSPVFVKECLGVNFISMTFYEHFQFKYSIL